MRGDLTICGSVVQSNVGIFCTGRVTIIGKAKINGFIYAGKGLVMAGKVEMNGAAVVNGRADISGNVGNGGTMAATYYKWLQKK